MPTRDITCDQPHCGHTVHLDAAAEADLTAVTVTHEDGYHDVTDVPDTATVVGTDR